MYYHLTDFEIKYGYDREVTIRMVKRDHEITSHDNRLALAKIHLFVRLSLLELVQDTALIVLLLHNMSIHIIHKHRDVHCK